MKLPETDEEITEFIRAVDAGEIESLPAPNAKLLSRLCIQQSQIEKLERERNDLLEVVNLICGAVTGHAPRELCTTVEAVEWLVDRHKAATAALYKLEEIRTDKLAQAGFSEEPTAISEARHILRHNNISEARPPKTPNQE